MKTTYKITIQHIVKEEVEMEVDANSFMEAFDEVQTIINIRNSKTNKKFAINKLLVSTGPINKIEVK